MIERRDFLASVAIAGLGLAGAAAASAMPLASARKFGHGIRKVGGADLLVAMDPPSRGMSVYEPHIAVDPANPARIAVAAMYGVRGGRGGRNIQLWLSEDAGRTWFSRRVPRPQADGEFAADALAAFGTDGSVLVASDFAGKALADGNEARSFTRMSVPPAAQMMGGGGGRGRGQGQPPARPPEPAPERPAGVVNRNNGIAVSWSADSGRTISGTVVPPGMSPSADKTAIAVDRYATSAHRGNVYVVWEDRTSLQVARSTDGGRTFVAPFMVRTWAMTAMHQIAVRPDGSVHLMWALAAMPGVTNQISPQADAPPDAGKFICHAVSTDGGATFSKPVTVASNAGLGKVGMPSLAVDGSGRMLWVWGQTDALPDPDVRPILQPRHRLYAIRSDDGARWSEPYLLCPSLPATTHMGLPAVTSDGKAWWILTYLADDKETRVVLLRSDGSDGRFQIDRTLAKRSIPVEEFSLMGTFALRLCDDVAQVGDYVGISAAESRVASAFILPETDNPTSRATAHVAVTDTR